MGNVGYFMFSECGITDMQHLWQLSSGLHRHTAAGSAGPELDMAALTLTRDRIMQSTLNPISVCGLELAEQRAVIVNVMDITAVNFYNVPNVPASGSDSPDCG